MLLGPDGRSGTVLTDADNGSLESWGIPRPPARLSLADADGATYLVQLFDEDDHRGLTLAAADQVHIGKDGVPTADANGQVLIHATGVTANGTTKTAEVAIIPTPSPAIVSNGALTVAGNVTVSGTHGHVYSNGVLQVGGNVTITGNATGSAGYTEVARPDVGGSTDGSAPSLPVIDVNAADYRYLADLILTGVGLITDPFNVVVCDASAIASACETAGYTWVYGGARGWQASSLGADTTARVCLPLSYRCRRC